MTIARSPQSAQAQEAPSWSKSLCVNLDSPVTSDEHLPNVRDCDSDLFDTILDLKTGTFGLFLQTYLDTR